MNNSIDGNVKELHLNEYEQMLADYRQLKGNIQSQQENFTENMQNRQTPVEEVELTGTESPELEERYDNLNQTITETNTARDNCTGYREQLQEAWGTRMEGESETNSYRLSIYLHNIDSLRYLTSQSFSYYATGNDEDIRENTVFDNKEELERALGYTQEEIAERMDGDWEEFQEFYQTEIEPKIIELEIEGGNETYISQYESIVEQRTSLDEDMEELTGMDTVMTVQAQATIEGAIVQLNSVLEQLGQTKKTLRYSYIMDTEDYQNYTLPVNELNIEELNIENRAVLENIVELKDEYPDYYRLFNYIYETEGIDAVNQYLDDVEYDINQIEGYRMAEEYLATLTKDENGNYDQAAFENYFSTFGKGLLDGTESFFDGLGHAGNAFLAMAGLAEANDVRSANEWEAIYIGQALAGQDPEEFSLLCGDLDTSESNSVALETTYNVSSSIGNMMPSILLSMVSQPLGMTAMGVSAGGNSYHNALVEGYSFEQAIMYGINGVHHSKIFRRLTRIK